MLRLFKKVSANRLGKGKFRRKDYGVCININKLMFGGIDGKNIDDYYYPHLRGNLMNTGRGGKNISRREREWEEFTLTLYNGVLILNSSKGMVPWLDK